MDCIQVMDTDSFTDLLLAAMSESGLIDLETSNDQPVGDISTHFVANSRPVVGIPTSQQLQAVTVQPPQLRTNSIIVRYPQLQIPAASPRLPAVHTSAVPQKGVHKIVIRPVPSGMQQSMLSRPPQPVALQSADKRQPLIQTNVTFAGQTSVAVVRPSLSVLQTTTPLTRSTTIIRPQTAPSVSSLRIPSTTNRPALNTGTFRFTAIPRQLAARLPTVESSLSLQIRPKLPAGTVLQRTTAQTPGSIVQPASQTIPGRPTLIRVNVPSTASSLVLSSSSSTAAVVSISSSLPCTTTASVAQLAATSAGGCASCVAGSVFTTGCVSSVPIITSVPNITSGVSMGSTSVTSTSADIELSLVHSSVTSQANTLSDRCSVVTSSLPTLSTAGMPRSVSAAAVTGTVTTGNVNGCLSVISSGSMHTPTSSLAQPSAVNDTVILSEKLTVTVASSVAVSADAEHAAAETKSTCTTTTNSTSAEAEAEADDQQVRLLKISTAVVCMIYTLCSKKNKAPKRWQ